MKYLYLYTTETYTLKNWYKIGETTIEPKTRIRQQDTTSNPEPLILVACWQISEIVSDKDVHKKLNKQGFFRLRNNREWFELSKNPKEDIENVLHSLNGFDLFKEKALDIEQFSFIKVQDYKDLWWFNKSNPPL